MKLLTIRHPSIEADLYDLAAKTHDSLEHVHPGGKLLTGVRAQVLFKTLLYVQQLTGSL